MMKFEQAKCVSFGLNSILTPLLSLRTPSSKRTLWFRGLFCIFLSCPLFLPFLGILSYRLQGSVSVFLLVTAPLTCQGIHFA